MLSKRAKYALKALLALTEHKGDEPVRIADTAARERIPPKFLELILLDLRNQDGPEPKKAAAISGADPRGSRGQWSGCSMARWPGALCQPDRPCGATTADRRPAALARHEGVRTRRRGS
jgi:hypothetical protein